ncbi:hypothetical protein CKO25_11175 [Thiocapsa imhoffii]|uniref:Enolase n=2 Tax=Thiocapsa imhoffii TaxID=382777 RepID=A0A9X0WI81_9GAMM|nr:hypothetical protein [Thiocapsa imhoffii]
MERVENALFVTNVARIDRVIADLKVALGTKRLKTGTSCCGERVETCNPFTRTEEALGSSAEYAGRGGFVHVEWEIEGFVSGSVLTSFL